MENNDRKQNDYIDLSRWEIQNYLRVNQTDKKTLVPKKATVRYKVAQFIKENLIGWLGTYLVNRFGKKHKFETYTGTSDNGIYPLDKTFKVALLSDWATNTIEADAIAKIAKAHDPDYSIHLGDVYFVGNEQEIANNFDPENDVWQYGKHGSLALPGNHEYYANGNAFYEVLLKKFMWILGKDGNRIPQSVSFFCLENDHWRVIGLDTAYHSAGSPIVEFLPFCAPNCRLHKTQLEWLENVLKINNPNDKRGIIFLGHHQYYCAFGKSYSKQGKQLKKIMDNAARPVLWFWGHEHVMAFYDKNFAGNGLEAYGRCIGNGGMPIDVKKSLKPNKVKATRLKYFDGRHSHTIKTPRLWGLLKPKNVELGYNAFAMLTFDGPILKIEYVDQDNTILMEEKWQTNQQGEVVLSEMEPNPLLTKIELP